MLCIIAALSMTDIHDRERKKGEDSDRSADVNQTRAAQHMAPLLYVNILLNSSLKTFFTSCGFTNACMPTESMKVKMLMLILSF